MMRSIDSACAFGLRTSLVVTVALLTTVPFLAAQTGASKVSASHAVVSKTRSPAAGVERGKALFTQNCAFCHGRDAGGGETGPSLTDSELVGSDIGGNKIGVVVRNGRPENGMPAFKLSPGEIAEVAAFLHEQKKKVTSRPGGRRGVAVSDLQTGNVESGKQYFNGAGTCSSCHSPTGDLAGVAKRYRGLELEKRMLYPRKAPATVSVTLPSGQSVSGKLSYQDEFTIALTDASGWYQSWPKNQVKFTIQAPAEAHVELLEKYTDDDVHNLMAFLQTLR